MFITKMRKLGINLTRQRILTVVGLFVLLGLLLYIVPHRFVADITVEQYSEDEFLSAYPKLMEQVTALRQTTGDDTVKTSDIFTVYTVTERSLLFGTSVYHLLPFCILRTSEGMSTEDAWQTEFQVLADISLKEANFAIQGGTVEIPQYTNESITSSSMHLLSDYRIESQNVSARNKLCFTAWWGKSTKEPVVVSFVPDLKDVASEEGNFREINVISKINIRIGCYQKEMVATVYSTFSA